MPVESLPQSADSILENHERHKALAQLRLARVLVRQERATLLWVSKTHPRYFSKYELPFKGQLRTEVGQSIRYAHRAGGGIRTSDRLETKIEIAVMRIISIIENELRKGWAELMTTHNDIKWFQYHTRKVFAELGGWDSPNGI